MKQRIKTLCAGGVLAHALFGPAAAWTIRDADDALWKNDYATALQILRPLAEQGDAWAQDYLGKLYYFGHGVLEDYAQAAAWYLKAAEQGNATAQVDVGTMYQHGWGVPQDYVRAHMWYNLAAAGGSDGVEKAGENLRGEVAAKMTPAQIAEAQRMASEWVPKK